MKYFIGLMSGTSIDAIDAAVVNFENETPELVAAQNYPINKELKSSINNLYQTPELSLVSLGELNTQLGHLFSDATLSVIKKAKLSNDDIIAIGSHGQTIFHSPNGAHPFSMQLGDPSVISAKTGIATVAHFRNKDIALGGQGAPLTPLFHEAIFRNKEKNRVIVNIGGIANITILPAAFSQPVTGFDTGPGNALIDGWVRKNTNESFDNNGHWAKSGTVIKKLLNNFLRDDYFAMATPKSTGREHFNMNWLNDFLIDSEKPEDIQNTLTELTAMSIAEHIKKYSDNADEIIVCGGGVHNQFLMERLSDHCTPTICMSSAKLGVDPDWIEAMTFAWLAKKTIKKEPVNLSSITGGSSACILGGVYR